MTTDAVSSIKLVGGRPGWTFHIHGGHAMELDWEGVFGKDGVLKIPVAKDFYSVGSAAWMWSTKPSTDPDGGAWGLSLPLQIRAGDTIDIGV